MFPPLRSAPGRASSLGMVSAALLALGFFPAPVASAASGPHTIVLDAGHGGFDRGGIPGQRVAEKTMALDLTQRVQKKLRAAGYRVIMTRDSDVFVPLGTRVAIANAQRDAEFVCIHFNSAARVGANGIETYYYRSDSARLAANIHRQVVSGTETENRGIRRRGFYVLRRTSIPSVLVECGFLTNPEETRLVLQSSYRDRLAEKITAGIQGRLAPYNRPVLAGLTHVRSPIGGSGNDFVVAGSTSSRPSISHHSRKSSKNSSRHSTKSTKKKKKKSSADN